MNSAIERLLSLRVADVMQREVVEVPESADMATASELLLQHDISGAPVVDDSGRCVGMLSAVDFMKKSCRCRQPQRLHASRPRVGGARLADNNRQDPCTADTTQVNACMSRAVQSVQAEATLLDAARQMCDLHIHRLPVLDHNNHAVGFISSLDVVAAVIAAIEE